MRGGGVKSAQGSLGEVGQDAWPGAGQGGRDGERAQPGSFGYPAAGVVAGKGEGLHPGGQVSLEGDDGAPDLILGEGVQGQVGEPGVFGDADAVLDPGPAAVAQLQVGHLGPGPAGAGVGHKRGGAHAVGVLGAQLGGAGVGAFLADDDAHARRPRIQV